MEKNLNSRRLLAFFFAMAVLFALSGVDAIANQPVKDDYVISANIPPGHDEIANACDVVLYENIQPQICIMIERGVSVPYLGLTIVADSYIYNEKQSLSGMIVYNLTDKCSSMTISPLYEELDQPIQNSRHDNQLRGANTRLDIGERVLLS